MFTAVPSPYSTAELAYARTLYEDMTLTYDKAVAATLAYLTSTGAPCGKAKLKHMVRRLGWRRGKGWHGKKKKTADIPTPISSMPPTSSPTPDLTSDPAPDPDPEPFNIPDMVRRDREVAASRAAIRELKELVTRRAFIEEVVGALKEAALTMPVPALWEMPPTRAGEDEEEALLLLGDVHVGQHTAARINAGWDHTVDTTAAQLRTLAEKVLLFHRIHQHSGPWRRLTILDLGDDVEGSNMRASQHRIVDPLVTGQVRLYGQLLAEFVSTLLQAFEVIRIERVPGNHGRVSEKAGNAGLDELDPANSHDWLAGEFARAILAPAIAAGRVELVNHQGYWAVTEVAGQRIVFEHGSSMKASQSFVGIPAYGLARLAAKYRELVGTYDLLALGHWHQYLDIPAGYSARIVVNGALPPTTPYVAGNLHASARPTQVLMSLHPAVGRCKIYPLYLDTPREPAQKQYATAGDGAALLGVWHGIA